MSKFKGIIFDMDGLLFDTESIYCQAQTSVARKYGIPFDEQAYLATIGISDQELHQKLHADYVDFGQTTVQKFIDESQELIEELFAQGNVAMKPGVRELLNYLEEAKIPRVIASSNVRRFIDILLEKHQLQSFFSGIVSGEEVEFAKPHPEIVEKAIELLKIQPEQALMLEDSLNGIRAASSAGVPVMMVPDLIAPNSEAKEKVLGIYPSLHDVQKFLSHQ